MTTPNRPPLSSPSLPSADAPASPLLPPPRDADRNSPAALPRVAAAPPTQPKAGRVRTPEASGQGIHTLCAGYEPIAGYVLQEPIGKGGFGEVWSAIAPGGFLKAIKFVFGARDEKRAGRELRSLEHMTGVNHPFLLTLERYEFVEDRLVIVSELADGSLEDVYNRQIERGSCGIPRAALLSYLRDTADALDYLHEKFQLQHLDIKPGNLLLVGGHVKVADFGLLKDLRDEACSMIGGLTPVYAPPEVFDGRPSRHSDQYSLAVMYQELLTGKRPFSGRTIAQLATQHIHSTPDLDSLPPCDRPILARALEKDPQRRYAGCRELVEALASARGKDVRVRPSGRPQPIGSDTQTGMFEPAGGPASAPVEHLPGLSTSVVNDTCRAGALVVAVGGLGADVLLELHQRIRGCEREPAERIDSILIDTDQEKLHLLRSLEGPDGRSPCRTVYAPLRSPAQYRQAGTDHLRSISRRWIYNVPRSRSTEGMRPLGRLAMVDHGQAIRTALAEAIAQTAADSPEPPTVYLTGSLTGGTGSGMLLDIAYLLRHLLDQSGLEQSEVIPLMAGSTTGPPSRNALGNADAAAALNELAFYLRPENGYPGDQGAGWPSVPAARSPLRTSYVLAGDERTDGNDWAAATIAEYIWYSSQGMRNLLAAARHENPENSEPAEPAKPAKPAKPATIGITQPAIRSLGIVKLSPHAGPDDAALRPLVVTDLLRMWTGRIHEARALVPSILERLVPTCGFLTDSFEQQQWQQWPIDAAARRVALLKLLARWPITTLLSDEKLQLQLAPHLEELRGGRAHRQQADARLIALRQELAVRLRDRRIDLCTAAETVQRLAQRMRAEAENVRIVAPRPAPPAGLPEGEPQSTAEMEVLMEYAARRMDAMLHKAAQQGMANRMALVAEGLSEFAQQLAAQMETLEQAAQRLGSPGGDDPLTPCPLTPRTDEKRERLQADVDQLHDTLAANLLCLPLLEVQQAPDAQSLLRTVQKASRQHRAAEPDASPHASESVSAQKDEPLAAALQTARPALLDLGGKQRLLLVVGSQEQQRELKPRLERISGGPVTSVVLPGTQPALIHEAQDIPLPDMLKRLGASLGGNQKIAARLQSRVDVDWPNQL
ncbi:protein kinase domain-containing protein [Roseimaritima sediminicola]|uniref:protein kinase domain-containing protein n=1 Tax=Roseimaritima sediminicola TaxID=2662066 RepID=UPI0012982A6C|nr:tubulin-like doman-containing protein [Roseimaritima sediminicola]